MRSSKHIALSLLGTAAALVGFRSCLSNDYYGTTQPSGGGHWFSSGGHSGGSHSAFSGGTSRGGFGGIGHGGSGS